jgi:pimeloyl-ACP methyl ester carboxylesterase
MRYAVAVLAFALFSPTVRAQEKVKTFDAGGVKITYLDEGSGEAVVLLHGFSASAEEMWTKIPFAPTQFLPELAKQYRVIAPDFRGHGGSDKPHDPKKYGAEMAEDVVRLLDHLKVKKAHVVGYSMGAMIAGKFLVTHPDRLLSVTFGGAAPLLPQPKGSPVLAATVESLEKGKGITPLIVALTPDGEKGPTAEVAAAFSELFLKGKDQKALAAVLRGFPGLEVTEAELKANKVPVQFVYGNREASFLKDAIAAARKVMPKAGEVVIEKGDHGSTFTTPEFRKAVLAFLKANKE